jgi:hypothetical protein
MANPDLLPEPRLELVAVTVSMDTGPGSNLEWLDRVADDTGRSRSDALREILNAVRAQQTRKAS